MKVSYYRHDRGADIKWIPKCAIGNDAKDVFTISFTWMRRSWIYRFQDTCCHCVQERYPDGMTKEDDRRFNRQWEPTAPIVTINS